MEIKIQKLQVAFEEGDIKEIKEYFDRVEDKDWQELPICINKLIKTISDI